MTTLADRLQNAKDNQPQTEMRLVDANLLQEAINTLRLSAQAPQPGDGAQEQREHMLKVAKELRENSNGDCNAIQQAIMWEKKAAALQQPDAAGDGERPVWRIEHDGFVGVEIGSYTTLEGKEGVVLQQVGTKVVHVYGRKWLVPCSHT